MRYAGGLLGGTWPASLSSDLGAGKFDGAYLVQNFENLNPANTFWNKYYNVFANIDTEPQRFLEFERWWGGYFLLNREEIEWITQNLFVGNKLWSGAVNAGEAGALDLATSRCQSCCSLRWRQHHAAAAGVQLSLMCTAAPRRSRRAGR
jgi:poly(3-hydroxyalkanoate) synthetase